MNEEYRTLKVDIPKLNNLEIKRDINDMLYCMDEINELIIKNKQEMYIRELLNRIKKAIEIIESYNLGKYDYLVPSGGITDLLRILKGDKE